MAREYDFFQSAKQPGINEMTRARDLIKSQLPAGANAQPYVPEPSWAMQKYRENVPAHIRTYGEALFNSITGQPPSMITEADFTPQELADLERIVATDRDFKISDAEEYLKEMKSMYPELSPGPYRDHMRATIKESESDIRDMRARTSFPINSYRYSAAYDGTTSEGSDRPSWGARPWGNTLGSFMVKNTPDGYIARDIYDFAGDPVPNDLKHDYASMNPANRFVSTLQDMKKGLFTAPGLAYLGDTKKAPRVSIRLKNLKQGQYNPYPVDPESSYEDD